MDNLRHWGPLDVELNDYTFKVLSNIYQNYGPLKDRRAQMIQLRTELSALTEAYCEISNELVSHAGKAFPPGLGMAAIALRDILVRIFEATRCYWRPANTKITWPFTDNEQEEIIKKIHSARELILASLKPLYN